MSPTYREGGSAKRWPYYSKSLFSKMGDKVKGGVKNLQKWLMSFMDTPKIYTICQIPDKFYTDNLLLLFLLLTFSSWRDTKCIKGSCTISLHYDNLHITFRNICDLCVSFPFIWDTKHSGHHIARINNK